MTKGGPPNVFHHLRINADGGIRTRRGDLTGEGVEGQRLGKESVDRDGDRDRDRDERGLCQMLVDNVIFF